MTPVVQHSAGGMEVIFEEAWKELRRIGVLVEKSNGCCSDREEIERHAADIYSLYLCCSSFTNFTFSN